MDPISQESEHFFHLEYATAPGWDLHEGHEHSYGGLRPRSGRWIINPRIERTQSHTSRALLRRKRQALPTGPGRFLVPGEAVFEAFQITLVQSCMIEDFAHP